MKYALVSRGSRGIGRAVCVRRRPVVGYHVLVNCVNRTDEAGAHVGVGTSRRQDGEV